MAYVFNSFTSEAGAGRSRWVWGQCAVHRKFQARQGYAIETLSRKLGQNKSSKVNTKLLVPEISRHINGWRQAWKQMTHTVGYQGSILGPIPSLLLSFFPLLFLLSPPHPLFFFLSSLFPTLALAACPIERHPLTLDFPCLYKPVGPPGILKKFTSNNA